MGDLDTFLAVCELVRMGEVDAAIDTDDFNPDILGEHPGLLDDIRSEFRVRGQVLVPRREPQFDPLVAVLFGFEADFLPSPVFAGKCGKAEIHPCQSYEVLAIYSKPISWGKVHDRFPAG